MKEYTSASIRNVALVSHSSAGKTMMAEAFLHFTGVAQPLLISRMRKSGEGFHYIRA